LSVQASLTVPEEYNVHSVLLGGPESRLSLLEETASFS
jgi:hypothetical protein